jgi:hypothetical protein
MRRTSLLVAGALIAGTALSSSALADRPARVADGPLARAGDVAWMLDLEQKLNEDNFQYGKAVAAYWPTTDRTPGGATGTGGWGDSGLWNGVYLGGQSYRYATAKAHLAALPGAGAGVGNSHEDNGVDDERDFWTEQRDDALHKITESLRYEHVDINIAEDWQGSLKVPAVNPNGYPLGTDRHLADFGGGVVQGQKGMIMRACTPAGVTGPTAIGNPTKDDAQPVNDNSNRVFQITWTHGDGDGRTYNCEASPSRDTYAGLTFGLLTAYDLVGPDLPALRKQIRDDLQSMGDFLIRYGWTYPRPHGYVSASHDFDGFISPLFVQVPLARLNLTNAVRHVLADGDDAVAKAKWDAIWAEELVSQGASLPGSMEIDSAQPNDGYYKFNLHHLTAFNLLRTTTGAEHDLIARGVAIMDKTTRDDVNAHFQTLMYGVTGESSRRDEAIDYLRQWQQYRLNTENGQVIRNSTRCGTELTCVPQDQYEIATPAGDVTWFPGQAAVTGETPELRAARPMPVANRAPSDFIWQRPPTQLDGQQAPNGREPGIDYLTPYWMLRYFTEVKVPALQPLPEWAGPAHY